jgi:hypothetical protein
MANTRKRGPQYHMPMMVVGVPLGIWNELVKEHNLLVEYFQATKEEIEERMVAEIKAGTYVPAKAARLK